MCEEPPVIALINLKLAEVTSWGATTVLRFEDQGNPTIGRHRAKIEIAVSGLQVSKDGYWTVGLFRHTEPK